MQKAVVIDVECVLYIWEGETCVMYTTVVLILEYIICKCIIVIKAVAEEEV